MVARGGLCVWEGGVHLALVNEGKDTRALVGLDDIVSVANGAQ